MEEQKKKIIKIDMAFYPQDILKVVKKKCPRNFDIWGCKLSQGRNYMRKYGNDYSL